MNLALATLAALTFHLVGYLPVIANQWVAQNLKNALIINVLLAVFNMMPLPPLDGGRVAVGLLPDLLAAPLARLEPYGMLILIGLLFIVPVLGAQMGVDLSIVSRIVAVSDRDHHQCHRPDNWKLITRLMLRQLGIVSWIVGGVIETIISAMADDSARFGMRSEHGISPATI